MGCVPGPDSPRSLPALTPQGARQSQRGLCCWASLGKPGLSMGMGTVLSPGCWHSPQVCYASGQRLGLVPGCCSQGEAAVG